MKSYTLVAIQFIVLILIALTGPILARHPVLLAMEIVALALAGWAVLSVRIGNFNIVPDVRAGSQLVRSGPYHYIRHPMYTSLLLGSLALVLETPSPLRWLLWTVLLIDLLVKLHYEEKLLADHFPEYGEFQRETKRLVPFVY